MSTRRLLLADWIEESDRLPGLSAPRAVTREVPDDRMLVAGADCDVAVEEGHVRRASIWHREGVPFREIAARVGHTRTSPTADTYTHVLLGEED